MKKSYDSKFKSRVVLEALRGDLTVAEIAGKYQIHSVCKSFYLPPCFQKRKKRGIEEQQYTCAPQYPAGCVKFREERPFWSDRSGSPGLEVSTCPLH